MADVPGAGDGCTYRYDPETWVEPDWLEDDSRPPLDDEWHCPHDPVAGHDRCPFHPPESPDERERWAAEARPLARLRAVLEGTVEAPPRFVGATFDRLDPGDALAPETLAEGVDRVDLRCATVDHLDLSDRSVAPLVDARGLTVTETATLERAQFEGGARFRHCRFPDGTALRRAQFEGRADFGWADFGDDLDARGLRFEFDAEGDRGTFAFARFGDRADFCVARFDNGVHLFKTTFGDGAEFRAAKFDGLLDLDKAELGARALFRRAEVTGATYHRYRELGDGADFRGCEFEGPVDYHRTTFGDGVSFGSTRFRSPVTFEHATFGDDASFADAQFDVAADFDGATLGTRATFVGATFDGPASFRSAGPLPFTPFAGAVSFDGAVFRDRFELAHEYERDGATVADCVGRFYGDASFHGTEFPDGVSLRRVSFGADASFEDASLVAADLRGADLVGVDLRKTNLTGSVLYDAELQHAALYGTLLADARINDATDFGVKNHEYAGDKTDRVPRIPLRRPRPRVRYDERNPDYEATTTGTAVSDYTRAAGVYTVLEGVAAANADPELASLCYRYRKDVQRKRYLSPSGGVGRRRPVSWLRSATANAVVRYGESPWRVSAVAGLVIGGCAVGYDRFDLVEFARPPGNAAVAADPSLLDALYFSTLTFSTLGMGTFQPSGPEGRALAIFETICGVVLLALLVFVFGRRATR